MSPHLRYAAVYALALSVFGCATTGGGTNPFAEDGGVREIRVHVQNQNFYDATLHAIGDNGRRRMGTVSGNQTAVFRVPWAFSGGLRVEIDLLAGPSCTTEPIMVSPGDDVQLQIMSDFANTTYCR